MKVKFFVLTEGNDYNKLKKKISLNKKETLIIITTNPNLPQEYHKLVSQVVPVDGFSKGDIDGVIEQYSQGYRTFIIDVR